MGRYNIDEVETDEGDQIFDGGSRRFAKRNADQPKRSPIRRKSKMQQEDKDKTKSQKKSQKNPASAEVRLAMKVECICPKCGQRHVKNFHWIGRGTPRKYCPSCKGGS